MSSVPLPPATYLPNLPENVITEGRLSDAQLEAVLYAGRAFMRKNPDGTRIGFFIGDGTGVGKGREISGIIMDQLRHGNGKGKAVWISDKHSLIKDAKRDWSGLGNNPDDIFAHESIKTPTENIDKKDGILFTAYSYMGGKSSGARIEQLKRWLGEDFDGVIVLDEAHNVNNVLSSTKGGRTKKPAERAIKTIDFIKSFPNARILYVSATGATEVKNLAMLDRLGLWSGAHSPFVDKNDFVSSISKGGTAAMELVARDLKAMGLFMARSLSQRAGPYGGSEDVTFRTLLHNLTPHQVAIYDRLAECWQIILQHINDALELCGGESSKGMGGAISRFWGTHQRFFNQIIISLQTPAVIQDIEQQLKKNNSIVIQLTNTFEANQEDAVAKLKNSGEDFSYEDLDISPKEVLINFLEACFPVHQMEDAEDDDGNIISRPVLDSNGKPVINDTALRMRQKLIDDVNSIQQFPESPLDMIIEHFGYENIAEITGRSRRFVRDANGRRVEEKRNERKLQAEINDFNNGRKRILIFSEKGGTGASYHASKEYKNQQKRIHYLLQPGWRADKAIQGLGRSHRSNEAHKPEYVLVTTDIPGQKRFLSTIARRLEQMGALTSGERKTTTQGLFSEDDNLEASYIQDAAKDLFFKITLLPNAINIFEQLGFDPQVFSYGGDPKKIPNVTRFLNRILSMKVDDQKKLFDMFEECIQERKAIAKAHNMLDIRTENINAEKISILQNIVIREDTEFGTKTRYLELELTHPLRPRTWRNVKLKGAKDFFLVDTGIIVAAVPRKRSETDIETGDISQAFSLFSPDPKYHNTATEHILNNQSPRQLRRYTKVSEAEAERLWAEQIAKMSKTYTEKKHMITGALLPRKSVP